MIRQGAGRMKKIILAPDSFKGTMGAGEVCDIMEEAVRRHVPEAEVVAIPLADGGEGMVEAYLNLLGGRRVPLRVQGPLGDPVDCFYGLLPNGRAVMEMAACAGLSLAGARREPLRASTYGVGQMLRHAQTLGIRQVLLGLGGSATNDCGLGMAAALGYRFLDGAGRAVEPLACNLGRISRILSPESPLELEVVAACDVRSPLCGLAGATYVFGPQKGVSGPLLERLDREIAAFAQVMARDLGRSVRDLPGAGAAGGLGAALAAFLGAELRPGAELLLDAAHFEKALEGADLVLTGEGRMDGQSAAGKVVGAVGRRAKAKNVPCVALCGSLGPGAEALYGSCGITAAFSALREPGDFSQIQASCRENLSLLADGVLRLLLAAQAPTGLEEMQKISPPIPAGEV